MPLKSKFTSARIDFIGRFSGAFLIVICLVCQASFADQPATATSIKMPNIKTHQPINSKILCGLCSPPKNLSFIQSANFSSSSPIKTTMPPIVAQNNTPTFPSDSEDVESKSFIQFYVKCLSTLAAIGIFGSHLIAHPPHRLGRGIAPASQDQSLSRPQKTPPLPVVIPGSSMVFADPTE